MNVSLNIPKKIKYLILSVLMSGGLFWYIFCGEVTKGVSILVTVFIGIVGTLFVQYYDYKKEKKNLFVPTFINIIAFPLVLIFGTILSLKYFPNLSLFIKSAAIIGAGFLMYISLLVGNIFLIVYSTEEVIPLYRVAATWSQILMVVLAIPFYTGVYKLPVNSFVQSGGIGVVGCLFVLFLNWIMQMDPDISKVSRGERLFEIGFAFFTMFGLSMSVSFMPTESFLRSLFTASLLMATLGYVEAHHKNKITKKLVFEFLVIILLFLFFTIVFNE